MGYRLGIDVGNTNTDCVILDAGYRIVDQVKCRVSDDVVSSIETAVAQILHRSRLGPGEVSHAMLGTTQVADAIRGRRDLNRVGVLRIGAPATLSIPPLTGWPDDLRKAVEHASAVVGGGHEYDGRPIAPLDTEAVRRFLGAVRPHISALAVIAVFAPVNPEHETWVREYVHGEYPDLPVSVSHEIGSIGLLERENATVLNAAVTDVARRATDAFARALQRLGVHAQLYLTQNDGTLMRADYGLQYPILTVACGPANSMRGAVHLSGLPDAVIVDMGGTRTDIGLIRGGLPRESHRAVAVGGVRTNFRMPDLVSLPLGGGARVGQRRGRLSVGPGSVGHRLTEEAEVYGGDVLTFTDVAVAVGAAGIGTHRPSSDRELCERAYRQVVRQIEDGIDRVKMSPDPLPVVLVGGGGALLPDRLAGGVRTVRPEHHDVANAIGAATAQVSGRVDRIFDMSLERRGAVLERVRTQAEADAVRAGADPTALSLLEVEEIPLAYLPGAAARIRMVVGGRPREETP